MKMTEDVLERVRAYVLKDFLYARPDVSLGEEDSLLTNGIIDSMGIMELIAFVESEFAITIEDEEITEENLGTLGAIARFVAGKRVGASAS
jgi:acyl carrier protein